MDVNDNAPCLNDRVVWTFFASKHRSYSGTSTSAKSGRLSGRLALLWLLIFLPHREAERRFCAVGNPARMPGGPTEQDRSEGMPSHSEAPNERGKSAWLLGAGRRSVFPSDSP
ncbi:hypothetical protein CES87_24410 [Pseudomonas sp. ERMR1:02]|nr:hypothetical protein CES87_24410 [Pseudomonas sp. ERMR1:02]